MSKSERQVLTWRLSDPGMGLLERAGQAALQMTLHAAEAQSADLSPVRWDRNDLSADSVSIRTTSDMKSAITKLFTFAWQVSGDVFYVPAIHRIDRDPQICENKVKRLSVHNGIMRTFLQHPRVQPKGQLVDQVERIDEDRQVRITYQPVDAAKLKPLSDLKKAGFFSRDGSLSDQEVELSGWVFPGIAPRYGDEVAWRGPAKHGLLLMLAPIVCLYHQLYSQRGTWLFVIPDVHDVNTFEEVRLSPTFSLDPTYFDVTSLGDAGLRFLAEYTSTPVRRRLKAGCRVVAMGKVGYYRSQSIRKGVVDVTATAQTCNRYRILNRAMGNRWMKRKATLETDEAKKNGSERIAEPGRASEPTDFVSVPTPRGRIADNLIEGRAWYEDLFEPLPWDRASLERQRKTKPGISVERLWFNNLIYQRGPLMELVQDEKMWDKPEERLFVEAFWQILSSLYYLEGKAVERGGSRSFPDRVEDLNEDIRRRLTRAKTCPLLRQTIADLLAKPVKSYRSPIVRDRPDVIWHLIDQDWKRARDLALLALVSYPKKVSETEEESVQPFESVANQGVEA